MLGLFFSDVNKLITYLTLNSYLGCFVGFYWWRKPEYPGKTIDLSQVTDKLYHISNTHLHERDSNSQLQW